MSTPKDPTTTFACYSGEHLRCNSLSCNCTCHQPARWAAEYEAKIVQDFAKNHPNLYQPTMRRWHWSRQLGLYQRSDSGLAERRYLDTGEMEQYVNALEAEVERLKEERSLLLHDADEIHAIETANRDLQAEVEVLREKAGLADRAVEHVELGLNAALAGGFLGKHQKQWLADYAAAQKAEQPS